MATADKVLSVLKLFSLERPEWTVEAIIEALGLSPSTAYGYVGSLVGAGLLVQVRPSRYGIGPAAIELDRIVRMGDPLIHRASGVLEGLVTASGCSAVALLCRLYGTSVICVDQHFVDHPPIDTSYERGRPMPLLRGAHSKTILANLSARPLRRFHRDKLEELASAGFSRDWDAFKAETRAVRRADPLVSRGEIDMGAVGIASPIFDEQGTVIGSVGLVISAQDAADPDRFERMTGTVRIAGMQLSAAQGGEGQGKA